MTADDVFTISSSTALGVAEHLLLLLNTVVRNLPESELRQVRSGIVHSVDLADEALQNLAISSTFEMLTMNGMSTIRGGDVFTSAGTARPCSPTKNGAILKHPAPPPSPASVAANENFPRSPVSTHNEAGSSKKPVATRNRHGAGINTPNETRKQKGSPDHPFILSSRPRVGAPDYTYHPVFIRTGIPGPYTSPPIDPSRPLPPTFYVITKGLYVGIFYNWSECNPWVMGVDRSNYVKVASWAEAMQLYNGRLAADTCEVLI